MRLKRNYEKTNDCPTSKCTGPQTAHGYSSGLAPLSGWCYILTWCSALFAAGDQHVKAMKKHGKTVEDVFRIQADFFREDYNKIF